VGAGAVSSHWVVGPAGAHPVLLQVMYGGRAIDSFDRRILTTYMDEYLGDFIFDTFQPFHFFRNKDVDYKIPVGDIKDKFVGELSQGEGKAFERL
jgi:hypothetical protein